MWSGIKLVTGFKNSNTQTEGSTDKDNELNQLFNRFNTGTPVVTPSTYATMTAL